MLSTLGAFALAALKGTQPPRSVSRSLTPAAPLGWGALGPIVVACLGLGVIFGAAEVVTVAFTDVLGRPGAAAVLLALLAAGSLVAGALVGSVGSGWAPLRMFRWGSLALGLSFVPMLLVRDVWVAAGVLLLAGLAISPSLVAAMTLVERAVPASRLTEEIGWTTTGLTLGVAVGAAVSGAVVDAYGASAGFAVPLAAGTLATVAALLTRDQPVRDS